MLGYDIRHFTILTVWRGGDSVASECCTGREVRHTVDLHYFQYSRNFSLSLHPFEMTRVYTVFTHWR